jgi:hypothetical protein
MLRAPQLNRLSGRTGLTRERHQNMSLDKRWNSFINSWWRVGHGLCPIVLNLIHEAPVGASADGRDRLLAVRSGPGATGFTSTRTAKRSGGKQTRKCSNQTRKLGCDT